MPNQSFAPSRRSFLARLTAVSVLPWLARASAAPTTRPPEPPPILLDTFHIAGFRYYAGPGLLPALVPGTPLRLRAEPANPHDDLAVEIFLGLHKLGYVPRDRNLYLSPMLQAELPLACRITAVDPKAPPWQVVEAAISLQLPQPPTHRSIPAPALAARADLPVPDPSCHL